MGMEIYLTQASLGDCILIRCGEQEKKVNILIDSGLTSNNVERSIDIIRNNNETIDLCMFTHDDNDHILGAKKLISKIIKSKQAEKDENSFNSILSIPEERMIFNFGENVKNQLLAAEDMHEMVKMISDRGFDYKKIGIVLADEKNENTDIKTWPNIIQIRWEIMNGNLKSDIIKNPTDDDLKTDKEHLEIVILSPDKEVLKKYVQNAWNKIEDIKLNSENNKVERNEWLKSIEYWMNHDSEMGDDGKLANMASIAFLIKYNGIVGLLSGDAHPDVIVKYAKEYLKDNNIDCNHMNLDFVKLPHHGSSHNISKEFIEFFRTDTYLLSTSGSMQYKHPGKITFAEILKSDNDYQCIDIYTNYTWWMKFEEWQQGDIVKIDDYTGECRVKIDDSVNKTINFRKLKMSNKIKKLGGKLTFSM